MFIILHKKSNLVCYDIHDVLFVGFLSLSAFYLSTFCLLALCQLIFHLYWYFVHVGLLAFGLMFMSVFCLVEGQLCTLTLVSSCLIIYSFKMENTLGWKMFLILLHDEILVSEVNTIQRHFESQELIF